MYFKKKQQQQQRRMNERMNIAKIEKKKKM
jgi:hypothetical protein